MEQQAKRRQEHKGASRFVAPEPAPASIRRIEVLPPETVQHTLDVPLGSTQHIEVKTSATDRAWGYLISNVPMLAAFALGVVVLRATAFQAPLWTLATFGWFWSTFVLAWLGSYVVTLALSAEGVAFYESHQKWLVVKREQRERWAHYKRLNGRQHELTDKRTNNNQ